MVGSIKGLEIHTSNKGDLFEINFKPLLEGNSNRSADQRSEEPVGVQIPDGPARL